MAGDFQNWNCSKNISTQPIPIIFDVLKTPRAETFISGVLVDIWQEYSTLRQPYLIKSRGPVHFEQKMKQKCDNFYIARYATGQIVRIRHKRYFRAFQS